MVYPYGYINIEWEMGCTKPPYFGDRSKLPHIEIEYVPSNKEPNAKKRLK